MENNTKSLDRHSLGKEYFFHRAMRIIKKPSTKWRKTIIKKRRTRWISIMLMLALLVTVAYVPSAHASGYHAFSVGTNYGSGDLNTSAHATTACAYYSRLMTSNYSIMPTTSILFGNFSDGSPRIKSDILFFCGHGNSTGMYFNYNHSGGSYLTGVYYTNSVYTSDGYY